MNADKGWDHKDVWHKRGKNFLVEVRRHTEQSFVAGHCFDSEGPHRWCVYAYIFPKHPHFAKFAGPDMWQEASSVMPLHGGASLLEFPMYEGKVSAVKVGCDYHHLHDNFTNFSTPDDAYEVFKDAIDLHTWLTVRAEQWMAA